MNGYFSSLIQQTGLMLGQQGESKTYRPQSNDNISGQSSATPDQPESLEIEKIIEVTAPSDSATPNHHETAKSVDEDTVKPSVTPDQPEPLEVKEIIEVTAPSGSVVPNDYEVAKSVKREASYPPEVLEQREATSSPEIIIPPKPVAQAKEIQQTREKLAELVNTDPTKTEISPLNSKRETTVESQRQTRRHKEAHPAAEPSVTEPSINPKIAVSRSPAPLEQHVYISQLPDTYQQAIKEWLVSPADESRDQPFDREKLKASLKRKQNNNVILKPKPAQADSFPEKQIGNGQFTNGDLHLSVGNINLTIEAPEPVNRQPANISKQPARRQQSGSSRLSRHYVRVR